MAYDSTSDPRREKLDRLLLVADSLENPPANVSYRQHTFKCGTAACAIGHALIKYERIGELHFAPPNYEQPSFDPKDLTKPENQDTFLGIADTFGISEVEAIHYFGGNGPPECRHLEGRERALAMAKELRIFHAFKVAELVL